MSFIFIALLAALTFGYTSEGKAFTKTFSQAGSVVVQYGYAADGTRLWEQTDQDPNQLQVWMGKIYEEKTDANGRHILFHIYAGGEQVCTCEAGSAQKNS